MTEAIRLTIITDSAERASLALFGFRLRTAAIEAPWCRFVDRTHQLSTIPDQAPVMALWFDTDPLMEIRWFNERHKRPFNDDWAEHGPRITEWLEKREARELALIAHAQRAEETSEQAARSTLPAPPPVTTSHTQPRTMWS